MRVLAAAALVRQVIGRRVAGLCYVASEAVYHLAGGKRAGLTPRVITIHGKPPVGSHWFLISDDPSVRYPEWAPPGVVDVTGGQFRPHLTHAEYGYARGCGFLTGRPSLGAREVIAAARRETEIIAACPDDCRGCNR